MTATRQPMVGETKGNGSTGPVADDELEVVEEKRKGPPPRLRLALLIAGAIVAVLVLIWGIRWIAYATAHQSTDDAKVDADTVTVTSKIAEHVHAIYTDTNLYVKKGQLLIQLENRDEQARYAQALAAYRAQQATANAAQQTLALTRQTVQAQTQEGQGGVVSAQYGIAGAQQQVAVAQQGVEQARSQLSAAQAGVPAAREAFAKADADYQRTSTLVASGDMARANLDAARAAQKAAQAQYQEARDNVAVAQANLDASVQRVAAAQAQVTVQQGQLTSAQGKLSENRSPYRVSSQEAQAAAAQAQSGSAAAQLRTASDQLFYTKIYAPTDGYVGLKSVDIGQQVAPGTPLLTIVPLKHVYITANFKETQIGNMRPGQQADIAVDAYKGVSFSGHVDAIAPASQNTFALVPAQNASGNFVKVTQRIPVRIFVDSASKPLSDVPLRPGMSVVASVKVK